MTREISVDARRSDGRGLPLARPPPGLLDAHRDDAVHRPAERAVGRQAGRLQAVRRPSVGVHGHRQGHAGDRQSSPISSWSTAPRAAPAPRRWNSSNHVGVPLREGLLFVHNTLVGARPARAHPDRRGGQGRQRLRHRRLMALGADWTNAARGFMFAIGCIQSLICNTNRCPTGVATQDPLRQRALVVERQGRTRRQLPSQYVARAVGHDRRGRTRAPCASPASPPGQARRRRRDPIVLPAARLSRAGRARRGKAQAYILQPCLGSRAPGQFRPSSTFDLATLRADGAAGLGPPAGTAALGIGTRVRHDVARARAFRLSGRFARW